MSPMASPGVAGLDQTPYDDILPTSPDTEQFLQASHTLSGESSKQSFQTSPSTLEADSQARHSRHTSTNSLRNTGPSLSASSNPVSLALSPQHFGHLSPSAGFPSEAGYSEISEHTTPGFDDDFLANTDFGNLSNLDVDDRPDQLLDLDGIDLPPFDSVSGPSSGRSFAPEVKKQTSLGTTATSSYLLSPVNTNNPSPVSTMSNEFDQQQSGDWSSLVNGSRGPARLSTIHIPDTEPLQFTPALTGSSRNSSGEDVPAANRRIGQQLTSPVVKVENYSRGDSPSREGMLGRSLSKRSRSSRLSAGHLSPHLGEVESSSEDEMESERFAARDVQFPSMATRSDDGSWVPNAIGQSGITPESRDQLKDLYVPNLKEQEEEQKIAEKNADVANWIQVSATSSVVGDDDDVERPIGVRRYRSKSTRRRRAKSANDVTGLHFDPSKLDTGGLSQDDSNIPGPGVLLDEDSGTDEDSESDDGFSDTSPASLHEEATEPEITSGPYPTVDEEPLPNQFYRSHLWQDPFHGAVTSTRDQPVSSNAAIMRFQQRADHFDAASRAATWGTRRMSLTDLEKVSSEPPLLKRLSFGRDKSRDRGEKTGNFLDMGKRLFSMRETNTMKRKNSDRRSIDHGSVIAPVARIESMEQSRRESLSPLRRASSSSKMPRSPKVNTGSAVAAMAGQIAAIGGSGSVSATTAIPSQTPWEQAKSVIRRTRSRSDIAKPRPDVGDSITLGLSNLMAQHGGPPMPTLASPSNEEKIKPFSADEDEEDEDDDAMEERGVKMELTMQPVAITPNFKGFQTHSRQLNPRLGAYLVDRISHEQVRRYKKLIDLKIKHLNNVRNRKCPSNSNRGLFCTELGGQAKILPPKAGNRDQDGFTGFAVARDGPSDEESMPFGEGAVAAAQFPPGVPLPPVKRLPAEFECPLCFKVKTFQKPSDWTKHVHEDVQPFTCTFPNCADPKSFKRKADWVRHENERHRQLEWWTCNLPDCSHTCYRKDNFVQHLVREHKKPEPKIKSKANPKSGTSSKAGANLQADEGDVDLVWQLVEECKNETTKKPRDEPCRFCGNVANTWKKLTVHLARHMEQISLPVLALVEKRDVTVNTIISPIEQLVAQRESESPLVSRATHGSIADVSPFDTQNASRPAEDALSAIGLQNLALHGHEASGQHLAQFVPNHQAYTDRTFVAGPMTTYSDPAAAVYANAGLETFGEPHRAFVNPAAGYSGAPSHPIYTDFSNLNVGQSISPMDQYATSELPVNASFPQEGAYGGAIDGPAYNYTAAVPPHSMQQEPTDPATYNTTGMPYARGAQNISPVYLQQQQQQQQPQPQPRQYQQYPPH
ncbi:MAG: hypothetical protein M1825_002320 [Sarcosagium campestre]|nr:MAG: hypothetical protein M1825_002320 [Sarcosagium campestre]